MHLIHLNTIDEIGGFTGLVHFGLPNRSFEPEILDGNSVPEAARVRAYQELQRTHRWLGNTSAILRLLRRDPLPVRRVLDIGCGHGALLQRVRRELGAEVVGFDLHSAPADAPVTILTGDAVSDPLPQADVAICVCVAHHLTDADLIGLIRNVSASCRRFILLDLIRHWMPLALFRTFVGPLLDGLNEHDGVVSLRRSYTPRELRSVVDKALEGSSGRVQHSVSPFYIRQVMDISW
jgi:2-polyprenyl-3-methyl-5-hydroxy-6-metoxy-1,4-benzoquinol methylase